MAIRLTKTSKVIFAVVITILSVALGFLIWRVNQVDQLDPGDSDAGGGAGSCCVPSIGCVSGWVCKSQACNEPEGAIPCTTGATGCDTCGTGYRCRNLGSDITVKCIDTVKHICQVATGYTCVKEASGEPPGEGECKNTVCEWPEVLMSGRIDPNDPVCRCELCSGVVANDPYSCNGNPPTCTPKGCPSGMEPCGTSEGHEGGNCVKQENISCVAYHPDCNNPTYVFRYCKPIEVNTCDGGNWVNKPTGNINYGTDISFSAKAKDKDGIKKSSIVVKKGDTTLPVCSAGQNIDCISLAEATTETTISGNLSTAGKRLAPGNYTVNMSWKDNKDASSTACALTTSFTVLPQQTNPNWNITKSVVEQCVEEGTANPKSELTYTITVKNTGDGAGTISKIEDVLDSKVIDSFVQTTTITSPGIYSSGKITWNYATPLSMAAGETKVFTYKLVVGKEHFDTYSNTVTLTPVGSSAVVAAANITADCEITEPTPDGEVPQTGIFDTTVGRIVAGFTLILFGVVVYNVPNGIFKKRESYKYRERFEKKVANR